jgi:hypothetical protein
MPSIGGPCADSYQGARSMQPAQVVQAHQQLLQQRIYTPDQKSLEKLDEKNKGRAEAGKPPLSESFVLGVTQQVEQVTNDPNVKDKSKAIDQIRKQAGLTKGEMKDLVTKRLSGIYGQGQKEMKAYHDQRKHELNDTLDQAKHIYGDHSAQAESVRAQIKDLDANLKPYEQQLGAKSKMYGDMYGGFWSKLKKVANIARNFVKYIPVVGTAIDLGIRAAQSIYDIAKYGWKEGLERTAMNFAGYVTNGLGDKLGDMGGIAAHIGSGIEKGYQYGMPAYGTAVRAANGDVLGAIGQGACLGSAIHSEGTVGEVFSDVRQAASTGRAIERGDYIEAAARGADLGLSIDDSGRVGEAFNDIAKGAHTAGHVERAVGDAVRGNFAGAICNSADVSREWGEWAHQDTSQVTEALEDLYGPARCGQRIYDDPLGTTASACSARLERYLRAHDQRWAARVFGPEDA